MTKIYEIPLSVEEKYSYFKERFQDFLDRMGMGPVNDTPFLFIQDEIDWPNLNNVGTEAGAIPTQDDFEEIWDRCTYPQCHCKESLSCEKNW